MTTAAKPPCPCGCEYPDHWRKSMHTLGPWRHDAVNHQIRTGVPTGKRFEGECIGSVSTLCPEMMANAKLIAAAPEMLEALELAKTLVENLCYTGLAPIPIPDARRGKYLIEAAIQKARGGQ